MLQLINYKMTHTDLPTPPRPSDPRCQARAVPTDPAEEWSAGRAATHLRRPVQNSTKKTKHRAIVTSAGCNCLSLAASVCWKRSESAPTHSESDTAYSKYIHNIHTYIHTYIQTVSSFSNGVTMGRRDLTSETELRFINYLIKLFI